MGDGGHRRPVKQKAGNVSQRSPASVVQDCEGLTSSLCHLPFELLYDPPALRGVEVFAPLPRVSARLGLARLSRGCLAFLGAPSSAASPSPASAFLPRRRSAAARSRPPTPFGLAAASS